jgi:hypothetical protein
MYAGRIIGEVAAHEASETHLGLLMAGIQKEQAHVD